MAQHRAHEDALRRLYLARPPATSSGPPLPSDTLVDPVKGYAPLGHAGMGEVEVVDGSSGRTGRRADESIEAATERRKQHVLRRPSSAVYEAAA